MTKEELDAIIAGIVPGVREHIEKTVGPLRERLSSLEGEIKILLAEIRARLSQ